MRGSRWKLLTRKLEKMKEREVGVREEERRGSMSSERLGNDGIGK